MAWRGGCMKLIIAMLGLICHVSGADEMFWYLSGQSRTSSKVSAQFDTTHKVYMCNSTESVADKIRLER